MFRQILHEYQFKCFGILGRDCPLMFSIRAKQRPIPSITASDPSKFQLYICFQSFRPDFFVCFSWQGYSSLTIPPHIPHFHINQPPKHPPSQLPATMSLPNKKHRISVRVVQPWPFWHCSTDPNTSDTSRNPTHPNHPMKRFKKKALKPHKNLNNTTPSPSFHRPNKKPSKQHAPPNFQAED